MISEVSRTVADSDIPAHPPGSNGGHPAQAAIVIPARNARRQWTSLSTGLRLQGIPAGRVLIVDCGSTDGTPELAAAEGYAVLRAEGEDTTEAEARQSALGSAPWASIAVYLTQDGILAAPNSLVRLLAAFDDPRVAAAYGRQLPRLGAGHIETQERLFLYSPESEVQDCQAASAAGLNTAALADGFAAYRVKALTEAGGFPSGVLAGEDGMAAGKLLLAGWKIAYVAEAQVYRSSRLTPADEFRHRFDLGVSHRRQPWFMHRFGKPAGESRRFALSELNYLATRNPLLLPVSMVRTIWKAAGYRLGLREAQLGAGWSRRLSANKSFWRRTTQLP